MTATQTRIVISAAIVILAIMPITAWIYSRFPSSPEQGKEAATPWDTMAPIQIDPGTTTATATLQNMPLPNSLVCSNTVTLLDKTGEPISISARTVMQVLERTPKGTLTILIDGQTYIGNIKRFTDWCAEDEKPATHIQADSN